MCLTICHSVRVKWKMTTDCKNACWQLYTDLFLLFTFFFFYLFIEKCLLVFHMKSLDSSILHVWAALIHFICSQCVFSLFWWSWIIAGQGEQTTKKKLIWSKNAWPQPWGAEGQHTGDHFCVRVRDIKKGPFLSEPKWGWGIGLNIFVPPNESGSLIFAGHMGCEAKPSGDDTGRWMLASLKRRQGK